MRTTKLKVLILCLSSYFAFGQQTQTTEDPFYYEIDGLVYVKQFNIVTRTKTTTQKIPKEPLVFKIVSTEIDASDKSTYYVIQFPPIINDNVILGGVSTLLTGNTTFINSSDNNDYFWLRKDELDKYLTDGYIKKRYKTWRAKLTYGASLSLPFKLRPQTAGQNIKITPDITLGGYLGLKWRISHSDAYYLSFPVITVGLAALSITDNSNPSTPSKGDGTVMGITGSWGGVFQLNDFQFGLIMGWDRAAGEIGSNWIYNNKPWYSFSIGYSFLGSPTDKKKQ